MTFKPLSLFILRFRSRSVAVIRERCNRYENILSVAQLNFQAFQDAHTADIVVLASIPGYPDQGLVEISTEIWSMIYNVVYTVTIALRSEMQPKTEWGLPLSDYDYRASGVEASTVGGLQALTLSSPISAPSVPPPPPTRSSWARPPGGAIPEQSRDAPQTAAPLPSDPDFWNMPVRKPVIYLFPPSILPSVTVELLLTSSWSFSAVYPPPQIATPLGGHETARSLTWSIAAEPGGTLVDKTTGTQVSYLYWEAIAKTHLVTPNASRATTPVKDIETFDPSHPSVSPDDSVLLPIGKVPGYLDAALKALALHTEPRTSFITYWLPDLLKHEYVAVRFPAQASYEQAAQMRVLPAPDVITRVFMLFRGVAPGDTGLWGQAAARATADDGATFWANVVGVDSVRASDRRLFRVLEWGGMEVK